MTITGDNSAHSKSSSQFAKKSLRAFLTISEVSKELELPQHVLRFWETKFDTIKPMKRGGGRRYYRPKDVKFLKQIQSLLYLDGYTIKGVQKLLRKGDRKIVPETATEVQKQSLKITNQKNLGLDELRSILAELEYIRAELHNNRT